MTGLEYTLEIAAYAKQVGVEVGFTDEEAQEALRVPGFTYEQFVYFKVCPLAVRIRVVDETLGELAVANANFLTHFCLQSWKEAGFSDGYKEGFVAGQNSMSLKKLLLGR